MDTIALPFVPPRPADTHKGDYGRVLVIAGSETMLGAAAFTALAALRTGAGLVRIAAPKEILPAILTICPFATGFPWVPSRMKELLAFAEEHDALAVGPGLGLSSATKRLVSELLERHRGPMVLDADALNALASLEPSEWPKRRDWHNVILTPHTGEFMRLMGAVMKRGGAVAAPLAGGGAEAEAAQQPQPSTKRARSLADDAPSTADGIVIDLPPEENASDSATGSSASSTPPSAPESSAPPPPDRTPLAELLAKGTGAVVVLKGHRSIITDSHRVATNTTGNPAMATAGSGDLLTGIIAALLGGAGGGQKMIAINAAVLGAHIHGLAGDLAREALLGPNPQSGGLLATDLLNFLPQALATRVQRV